MATPVLPDQRNLVTYRVVNTGSEQKPEWTAVFYYQDCIRQFDGRNWTAQTGRWRIDNDNTVFIYDNPKNLFTGN
jgi:hypothetical protein